MLQARHAQSPAQSLWLRRHKTFRNVSRTSHQSPQVLRSCKSLKVQKAKVSTTLSPEHTRVTIGHYGKLSRVCNGVVQISSFKGLGCTAVPNGLRCTDIPQRLARLAGWQLERDGLPPQHSVCWAQAPNAPTCLQPTSPDNRQCAGTVLWSGHCGTQQESPSTCPVVRTTECVRGHCTFQVPTAAAAAIQTLRDRDVMAWELVMMVPIYPKGIQGLGWSRDV